jgi:hypothetical protein
MTHAGVAMTNLYWIKVYNILVSVVEQLTADTTLKLFESREELLEGIAVNMFRHSKLSY